MTNMIETISVTGSTPMIPMVMDPATNIPHTTGSITKRMIIMDTKTHIR